MRRRKHRHDKRRCALRESRGITLSPNSVDKQIDSLLVEFADQSLEVDEDPVVVPEGSSIKRMLMLLEEKDDASDEDVDEPEDEITTDAEPMDVPPAKPLTPKINLDDFAMHVATLIETYTSRLDVETVIFNRAKNYIAREHGDAAAMQLEDTLVNEYGIDLRTKDVGDVDEPSIPQTFAQGAMGPSPS